MNWQKMLLCASVAGVSTLTQSGSAPAQDGPPAAFAIARTAPAPAQATAQAMRTDGLAPLPANAADLTFNGESARREFPVYVMAAETALPARLVLAYQSTVSVMPESSAMQVFVNDVPVGGARLGTGGAEPLVIDLDAGILQPGYNQVRIVVDQHHRVDCSVAGTYELWTSIDPARSGLQFPGARTGVENLDDLAALVRLGAGGGVAIHNALSAGVSGQEVDRAIGAIQSAILLGDFADARIDFGPSSGAATLDVIVGTPSSLPDAPSAWLAGNTALAGLTFEPAAGTAPARLVVMGSNADELDRNLAALASAAQSRKPAGTIPGIRALAGERGARIAGGEVLTLRDLGMTSRQFAGRFYREEVGFHLPADFYAADYADASFTLNAGYAAGLAQDAQLVVRANKRVVATVALSSTKRGIIENQKLRLPLSALRPGKNIIEFEATLPAKADAACEPAVQANPPVRLFISDTSALSIPKFARVGHIPDLATISFGGDGASPGSQDLSVLTPSLDPSTLAVAGRFIAKMAYSAGAPLRTRFVTTMPHEETGNLLAFGVFNRLPPELLDAVRLAPPGAALAEAAPSMPGVSVAMAADGTDDWQSSFDADGRMAPEPSAAPGGTLAAVLAGKFDLDGFVAGFSSDESLSDRLNALAKRTSDTVFKLAGFDQNPMSGELDPDRFYRPGADVSLVIAQGAAPHVGDAAWTIVAAPDEKSLAEGVSMVTDDARWDQIAGAVSSLHGTEGTVQSIGTGDETLFESQPRTFSNTRLVVAGWFSRHLESYVMILLFTCFMLGLSTFLFVRSVGERRR